MNMGLLSPYVFKRKDGKKMWLHAKEVGKIRLYYFSPDPGGAIFNIPGGYEVIENATTNMPFLKKKAGGGLFGKPKEKSGQKKEGSPKEEAGKESQNASNAGTKGG